MTKDVYAGGWEIAAENGYNKSIARFPDVCMSPPSPPAGPIPIPYPNTSFSNNLKSASTKVLIGGKGAALAQKSYYKEPVLGNEAATRTFGAAVITHQITGKTYFGAWCMDVLYEDKNVCRHFDITTSNHASYPGSTPPLNSVEMANQALAVQRLKDGKCPCCGKDDCAAAGASTPADTGGNLYDVGPPVKGDAAVDNAYSFNDFYDLPNDKQKMKVIAGLPCAGAPCVNEGNGPPPKSSPPCDVYRVIGKKRKDAIDNDYTGPDNADVVKKLKELKGVPKSPGDLLAIMPGADPTKFPSVAEAQAGNLTGKMKQLDHVTPRGSGGCPTGEGNTVANARKCGNCQKLDVELDTWAGRKIQQLKKLPQHQV